MNRVRMRCWILALVAAVAMPMAASAQTEQLPISAWIDLQTGSQAWGTQSGDTWLYFDVFGKRADALGLTPGTTFDGKVTVRKMVDGRAYVTVLVHTRNGICWGRKYDGVGAYPLAFGYTPLEVMGGMPASLGDGLQRIEFTMATPETPLPTPSELGNDEYPVQVYTGVVNCAGVLRAGSGYPDGTPGQAHVKQNGLFSSGFPGHCPSVDCWPAEVVRFWPTGGR